MQVWFRFYPLELRRFIERAEDKEQVTQELQMLGTWDLAEQIDTSHHFLYGHRFWPKVKLAIAEEAGKGEDAPYSNLGDLVKELSMEVVERTSAERPADRSLVNGIVAVGLMTLNQVGAEKFKAAKGEVEKPAGIMAKSPSQIVAARKKDDSQGLFGFLRTIDKRYSVAWTDKLASGKFQIMSDEEIASASARDQSQDWRERDPRCWEGVVPVECRSERCGTCWVGVLGGEEKLSEVASRERRRMKVFGYNQPDDKKPFLRLACQAKADGNATIVIPPWNGVFGRQVYRDIEDLELEPVTTSAQKLRETLAAVSEEEK